MSRTRTTDRTINQTWTPLSAQQLHRVTGGTDLIGVHDTETTGQTSTENVSNYRVNLKITYVIDG